MPRAMGLSVFLVAALVALLVWGRALWYFAERSDALRRWVFFVMGYTRRPMAQVRSFLLCAIYCALGTAAALLLAVSFGLRLFPVSGFGGSRVTLAVLGAVGEISLTGLLVELCSRFTVNGRQRLAEIDEIPWIVGVRELPRLAAPLAAGLGGVVEEFFFRGVILRILTDRFMVSPPAAIAIAGILFYVEQLVQLQTAFQALVIGCSCLAISALGGMLVVLTGSVVPALLAHASFVLFFITQGGGASTSLSQSRTGMVGR